MTAVGIGRVHTDDGTRYHIGVSATDDAFLDVFAAASDAGRPIRVHGLEPDVHTIDRGLRRIEALANAFGYEARWSFPPAVSWATLTIIDTDPAPAA